MIVKTFHCLGNHTVLAIINATTVAAYCFHRIVAIVGLIGVTFTIYRIIFFAVTIRLVGIRRRIRIAIFSRFIGCFTVITIGCFVVVFIRFTRRSELIVVFTRLIVGIFFVDVFDSLLVVSYSSFLVRVLIIFHF